MTNEFHKQKSKQKNSEPTIYDQILNGVYQEFSTIDPEVLTDKYIQLKNSIQTEISKKFENSKYSSKISEIFEKNIEILTDFFIDCQKATETVKINVSEIIEMGLQELKNQTENLRESAKESPGPYLSDEQFILMVNALSTNIRDFFKTSKKGISMIKTETEQIIDQLLYSKSNISDIFLHFNSSSQSTSVTAKYSQKASSQLIATKEKALKEKLTGIMERLDAINEIRSNLNKNVKILENNSNKFYEEAKVIFKRLKQIHSNFNNNEELFQSGNLNNDRGRNKSCSKAINESRNSFFNKSQDPSQTQTSFMRSKSKGMDSEMDQNKLLSQVESLKKKNQQLFEEISEVNANLVSIKIENKTLKEELKEKANEVKKSRSVSPNSVINEDSYVEEKAPKNKGNLSKSVEGKLKNLKKSVDNSVQNRENTENSVSKNSNSKNVEYQNEALIKMSNSVIELLKSLNGLQEAINNKLKNTKDLKKDFELKKKLILDLAESTLKKGYTSQGNMNNSSQLFYESNKNNITRVNLTNESPFKDGNESGNEYCNYANPNKIKDDEKRSKSVIQTNSFEKERESFNKEIEKLNEKLNLLNNENNKLKSKSNAIKDLEIKNKKLEEDNKTLLRECTKLDNEIKNLVERLNQSDKEPVQKVNGIKGQNEQNIKEIKKLNLKINDLSQENKILLGQIEEIKRDKQEKIDILNQNLVLKEKETKTFKDTVQMMKKDNEDLMNILENVKKQKDNDNGELKKNESSKEKERTNSEINYYKNQYETYKSQFENLKNQMDLAKKEIENLRTKLDTKIIDLKSSKDEIKALKEASNIQASSEIEKAYKSLNNLNHKQQTQIGDLESIVKSLGEDIEKHKKTHNEHKSIILSKESEIDEFKNKLVASDKEKTDLKKLNFDQLEKIKILNNKITSLENNIESNLKDRGSNLKQKESEILSDLKGKISKYEIKEKDFSNRIESLIKENQETSKSNNLLNEEKKQLSIELNSFKKNLALKDKEIESLKEQNLELNQKLDFTHKDIDKYHQKYQEINSKLISQEKEIKSLKDEIEQKNSSTKKILSENESLGLKVQNMNNELMLLKQDKKQNSDEIKNKLIDTQQKNYELENEKKVLNGKINDISQSVDINKKFSKQLFEIIEIFSGNIFMFVKTLTKENNDFDLSKINKVSQILNNLNETIPKNNLNELKELIKEILENLKERILILEEESETLQNKDKYIEEYEKIYEETLILLKNNYQELVDKYGFEDFDIEDASDITGILDCQHQSIIRSVEKLTSKNSKPKNPNNDNDNLKYLKTENVELTDQIESIREELATLKENNYNYLKKLNEIALFINFNLQSNELTYETKNEIEVVIEYIKKAIPVIFNELTNLKSNKELDEDCVQLISITYKAFSYTLVKKLSEVFWKNTEEILLNPEISIQKSKDFCQINVDKEVALKANLNKQLQDKEKELQEALTKAANSKVSKELENENEKIKRQIKELNSNFDAEKKKFEEENSKLVNDHNKKMEELKSYYEKILSDKDSDLINMNTIFKTEQSSLKMQLVNKDSELNEYKNKFNSLLNAKNKETSKDELIKNQNKEIENFHKKIKELTETIIPNLNRDLSLSKDNANKLASENENLRKEITESNEKIKDLISKNDELFKALDSNLQNEVEKDESNVSGIKAKLNDLREESEALIEEKNIEITNLYNEIAILKEEREFFLDEKEKVERKVKEIVSVINANEEVKSFRSFKKPEKQDSVKIMKSPDSKEEDDEFSIYRDLNDIENVLEKALSKINEYYQDKNEINFKGDKSENKEKELIEENNTLRAAIDEHINLLLNNIQEKTPDVLSALNNETFKNMDDAFKCIELFKVYHDELTKIGEELQHKLVKSSEKIQKYKKLYSDLKEREENKDSIQNVSAPIYYDPKRYRIMNQKAFYNLKWVMLVVKKETYDHLNYSEAIWVPCENLREDMYEKEESSFDHIEEIENLKVIQDGLLEKLHKKDEEINSIKKERELAMRNPSNQNLAQNAVPYDKFEMVLNQLSEEQSNFNKINSLAEALKKENETLKNQIESLNTPNIKKKLTNNEKEFAMKFLNNNEILLENQIQVTEDDKDVYNLDHSNIQQQQKMNLSEISQNQNLNLTANFNHQNSSPVPHLNLQNKDRRLSQTSIKKPDVLLTGGRDSMKDHVLKMEEDQKLFAEQLMNIKDELKETRKQRDMYKKQVDQSIVLKDEKKNDIVNILKQAIFKLIEEINLTAKIKEIISVMLRVIDFTDEQINEIFKKKESKKGIFGIFGGKK